MFKRRKLRAVYAGTRQAYLEHDGDIAAAESAMRADPAKYGFDPMTILTIIQIIIMLWQLWQKHRAKRLPESFDEFETQYREINAFEGVVFEDDDHEASCEGADSHVAD